ncbi:DUF4238 domain-containing protein [Alkalibaculum sporogenes]|uniref:DUF4238 domain-containing protein n=1 Tax=Alkalibaculum sporogenes TaxID=2655001 RepID=UPI00187B67B7|nr:DUF4238 domain-containing protein [Alkalibaculum sporogenes]
MDKEITRRQHYVPQFYLRNFIDNSKMFWIYNRSKKNINRSRPKDICRVDYLYETEWKKSNEKLGKYVLLNSMENTFSFQEKEYSKVLNQIFTVCEMPSNQNALICSSTEKNILAQFITNMLLRNPWSLRQYMQKNCSNDIQGYEELEAIKELLDLLGFGGFESLCEVANKRILLDEKFTGGIPENLIEEVRTMNFSILKTEEMKFITSDFPVLYETFDTDEGITKLLWIYLPISSKYALFYSGNNVSRNFRNRLVVLENEKATKMNFFYLKQEKEQSKFLIAEDKNVLEKLVNSM